MSQKRLFCIDPRGRAVDRRRRSGDSPKRAGSRGKRKRKERKKKKREKRKKKRRGGTSRHSTTFSSCCLKPGLESIVQSKRERVLVEEVSPREESSSEVLRRTPWALSTRYLGPPPLPFDSLARGRKTATDHRNWFVKVGSQRLYTLTVTKVTGTVSTYFGAGIDVASISSRARYLAVPRFNPWRGDRSTNSSSYFFRVSLKILTRSS